MERLLAGSPPIVLGAVIDNLAEQIVGLQDHVQADHEVLKALWNIHGPDGIYCKFDGFIFPCWERRMLEGSMPLSEA
jgi:hypothetical protein